MNQQTEVVIRRDAMLHRWVIVNGARNSQTPWSDDADAVSVVTWLKSRASGPVTVRSEEHTSELQSPEASSCGAFRLKKKK
jgi:hypothetical protein